MICPSIEEAYKDLCEHLPTTNPRYCEYCKGTSGLPREKERTYLDRLMAGPSLVQKAANLVKAVTKAAMMFAATGQIRVSDEVLDQRNLICLGCSENENGTCKACGCYLSIKNTWKTESCPLGKWPSVSIGGGRCGGCK